MHAVSADTWGALRWSSIEVAAELELVLGSDTLDTFVTFNRGAGQQQG